LLPGWMNFRDLLMGVPTEFTISLQG
jgi:hypothetical protein